jgi:hypothetical protein
MKKLLFSCLMMLGVSQLMAQAQWPAITQQARPWTRWWWMGSAVDENNISTLLKQYSESGLGGVEIVPIYGAKGYESRYIKYLSPRWMQMLDHTVSRANALNMGVYISVGTGWPIGGSHVAKEDAASKALVQQYDLKANTVLTDLIVVNDPKQKDGAVLSVLMGYNSEGKATDLTGKLDASGKLNFKPTEDLKLFALFNGKTRQAVKRAAPGGEGFTIDHFSKSATANYFKAFDAAFGNSSHGVKGFFNDSYEVYGANWTPEFFSEFSRRRGYDLKQHINVLFSDTKDDHTARIKSDYRETMADLMRENFSTVYTNWTHQRKALSINQAHGSPGNLLDLYGAFDVPETETFGSSYFPIKGLRRDSADIRNVDPDPNMLKFASSAAHAYGKPLTSCETFTWLSEHFKTSWSQCKPEVDQVFLSGVNHVFYHGTTYSPADAKWPGWLFYASVNFVPNNSLWPHLKGLNDYIARCQSVLQAGTPDNELAIYWPIYDIWHNAKGMDKPLSVHHVDDWLHPTAFYKNLVSLQNEGYALDFVSDKMLELAKANGTQFGISPKGGQHKVLLIPACEKMPVATFKNIIRLASEGAAVVIHQFPQDVPGYKDVEQQRQELKRLIAQLRPSENNNLQVAAVGKGKIVIGDVHEALVYLKVARETIADSGLKFIRRKMPDASYYFIVNNTANDFDKTISLQNEAATVLIMDPVNGTVNKVAHQKDGTATGFRLQLKSGASVIIKLTEKKEEAPVYKYIEPAANAIQLQNNKWMLSFKEGGPQLPATLQMTGIKPWTDFTNDARTRAFSGTGVYTTSFVLKNKAADYLLQLDQLYESARIIVNGKDAGLIWSLPFEKRIGRYLRPGNNTISIEVCNLMANRIRDMDQKGEVWRNYHEINFVNINYKDFDAGKWNVQPSGLGGTVQLVPLK